MSDKMKVLAAVNIMMNGGVVFSTGVDPVALGVLDGMVANSELCRCHHSNFTWYFMWRQGAAESASDKAHQMASAVQQSRSESNGQGR